MEPEFRRRFNAAYTDELYRRYLADFARNCGAPVEMQIAETPVFLPAALRRRAEGAGAAILEQLCEPARVADMKAAVPARWDAPNQTAFPSFCIIDFAIVRDGGELDVKLIELQGFPTLLGYETAQFDAWAAALQTIRGLDRDWTCWFSGLARDGFIELARRTILGKRAPVETILMDLDPPSQKTYPDFTASKRLWGVAPVCPTALVKRGKRLFRRDGDGKEIPVERIYNRVIFDEVERKNVALPFDFRDDLDVEWTPHPNWFWIWSKYSLPFLDHAAVPHATLVSQLDAIPSDVAERYVLKPLFSFAGAGVNVAPSASDVAAIPPEQRNGWCLQEKIEYAPVLQAVDGGGVKVELRMIYLRPDDAPAFTLAQNLCRLSRGEMMGVDHNKGRDWVGSSIGIWPIGGS